MGVWGEEGCVGFDHDAVEGREFHGFAEFLRVLVGSDACEGDAGTKVEQLAHIGGCACKAMKDESRRIERGSGEDRDQIIECFATMNDDGLGEGGMIAMKAMDEVELLVQSFPLQGGGGFFVMIVQAQFAPGDALGMVEQDAKLVPIVGAIVGVERMHACGAPDVVVGLGHGKDVVGIFGGCADGDAAEDFVLARLGEQGGDAAWVSGSGEVGEGEVAVRVDHAGGYERAVCMGSCASC